MALQNIGAANSDDAFYRYKMPRMITKIEGRGNGIKTNIVNMVDIAKALARPASYTTKYFGCELGAQSKFDEKTATSLVNGAHETAKLAGLLENFIKKYVQCYGCGNPETEITVTKTEMLTLKCAACGFVSDVDMRDKLTSFILKNPPESKKGPKDKKAMRRAEKERLKEGEAADEEQKKLKKGAKKKVPAAAPSKDPSKKKANGNAKKASSDEDRSNSPAGSQNGGDHEVAAEDDDDVEWQTDTSLAAAQKRIQEQLNDVTAEMVMLSAVTEEEEAEKTQKALVSDIKKLLTKGSTPSQLESFFGSIADTSAAPREIMVALFEALFEGVGKGFAKEVGKKNGYISAAAAAAAANVEGEGSSSQMILLKAVELYCGKANGDALKEAGLALKVLYDADLLEEEVIVKWYEEGSKGDGSKSRIWKNVKPFVEWLQNAESESEED